MIRGVIILIYGMLSAISWALCIIFISDRIFPMIITMSGVTEASPLWVVVQALEYFICIVLLIPWIITAYGLISFTLRIINVERAEWIA